MKSYLKSILISLRSFLLLLISFLFLQSCGEESSGDLIDGINDEDHRVFVTSTTYNGNLGGLAGADSTCATIAETSGLKRSYKAILSDGSSSALSRLNLNGAVYAFSSIEGPELVADSGSSFWNASSKDLFQSIQWDEFYQIKNVSVWTGSGDGGGITADHCSDWSSTSSGDDGFYGKSDSTNTQWIESNSTGCNNNFALYCISVDED